MAKIFTVDDQASVRLTIRNLLEAAGHVVMEADDGRVLIERLTDDIDLVITDMLMPEVDGIEVIGHVKRNFKNLPVLVVTGGWRDKTLDLITIAEGLGADRAISKAQIRTDLVRTVAEMLQALPVSRP